LYVVHSSSFPAGHAATAFAGAVLLSLLAPRLAPAFLALATLIGLSRIYDGVHYPTDVLAGAALGALVGAGAVAAVRLSPLKLDSPPRRNVRRYA
jgi:undecaprenyl-diphosphatase